MIFSPDRIFLEERSSSTWENLQYTKEILEEEGFIPCMQFEKGGEGLWLSRGGYQLIRWSKDGPTGAFLLFDQEGNPLSINAGTSCISLIDQIQRDTLVIS